MQCNLKNVEKYQQFINVSRWFDLIQHQLGSSKVLPLIDIDFQSYSNNVDDKSHKQQQAELNKEQKQNINLKEEKENEKESKEDLGAKDHRKIGQQQELFIFNDMSPGCCFWLEHGARVYRKLEQFMRECYKKRGFKEVISPNMFKFELFEQSGHADNYKNDMFLIHRQGFGKEIFALKPMNCPAHCMIYKSKPRSYKDLPLRLADFGVLHRNEASGSLSGLTRVRRFCQDDAHIFCRHDQIQSEIINALKFLDYVYGIFGFQFELELSTRPEKKYLGGIDMWNKAEEQLRHCLDQFCKDNKKGKNLKQWKEDKGAAAFYGPKIDIKVYDSLKRQHQCATIQLDFQIPIRFDLGYYDANKEKQVPVIVHRAIYGSFERFIGILIEHLEGEWPLWLSPRQMIIAPIKNKNESHVNYALEVQKEFDEAGFYCDVDLSDDRLGSKMKKAQEKGYNYVLFVGDNEIKEKCVSIRGRNKADHGKKLVKDAEQWFQQQIQSFK